MIEGAIYGYLSTRTALANTVGGTASPRIYPDLAPAKAVKPYIVFQEIPGGKEVEHSAANAELASAMVQFSVFAATSVSRETIAEALRSELLGYRAGTWGTGAHQITIRAILAEGPPYSAFIPPADASETGTYQATLTYQIWYRATVPTH